MGDSITLGVNDSEWLGWTGRVCRRLDPTGKDVTAYNLGVRASTTQHIKERWQAEIYARVIRGMESIAVFSFGAADIANGLTPEQSLENARAILHMAAGERRVLFICPPPMADKDRDRVSVELAAGFGSLCRELDIPYLDINTSLRQNGAYLEDIGSGDGVHPGKAGYEIMADLVYEFMNPFVQQFIC